MNSTAQTSNTVIVTGTRGGARPGAGRPKGTGNKLSGESILKALEDQTGVPYAEQLANNYIDALASNDRSMIHQYDKLFLSKVVADRVQVDMQVTEDQLAAKAAAFAAALEDLSSSSEPVVVVQTK
jgi:hypothetical protein